MAFKVKFDEKSINSTEKKIKDAFNKIISSQRLMNEVGDVIVNDIKFQTRRGYSIPDDKKFKPLTRPWIRKRTLIGATDSTHETFKENRSNLTLTGQLLDSLTHKVMGAGKILISFTGLHRPYRILTAKGIVRLGKTIRNEDLAKYVSVLRPFVGVRDQIRKRIKNIVISYIRRSQKVLNYFED